MALRLQFLGTAAAEGFPDPFCNCTSCCNARTEGNRSLRARSAALVNNDLLIDFGPDILTSTSRFGISLADVEWGLQTHPHADHLSAGTFFMRNRMCQSVGTKPLRYVASGASIRALSNQLALEENEHEFETDRVSHQYQLQLQKIAPWDPLEIGPYDVIAVDATHGTADDEAMVFAIRERESGASLFYCTDTGTLADGTWERLGGLGWVFDIVAIDFTFGFGSRSTGHMNLEMVLEEVARGRSQKVLTETSRILATHIAHHSNPHHSELSARCAPHGIEVAYDGLVVEAGR